MKKNGKIFSPFTDDGSTIWESCIIKKRKNICEEGREIIQKIKDNINDDRGNRHDNLADAFTAIEQVVQHE